MLEYFEGPAGSGKTYQLLKAAEIHLKGNPLEEGQKVLGLTFMHGARRRLSRRLEKSAVIGGHYTCSTIDSFARSLATRRRSLVNRPAGADEETEDRFMRVLRDAAQVVSYQHVRQWLAWSVPVVVIDEFQDCSPAHIELLSAIEPGITLFAAADKFQHLNDEEVNPGLRYLEERGQCKLLSGNRRTSVQGLLETAKLARSGQPAAAAFARREKGIWIQPARMHYQAAAATARNLVWYGGGWNAILSPVGPEKAPFFEATVERLRTERVVIDKAKGVAAGPFRIRWTTTFSGRLIRELEGLGLSDDADLGSVLSLSELRKAEKSPGSQILLRYLKRRHRLTGIQEIYREEAKKVLEEGLSVRAARSPARESGIEAMTVHQAKNQEFDTVVILWPLQAGGSIAYQRRLLYNAITRARRHACVLIQDPDGKRLDRDLESELFGLKYR